MNWLLALSLISLFLPLKLATPIVQLRPFDLIAILGLLTTLASIRNLSSAKLSIGFLTLIPFAVWHVISASTISADNGLREALQVILVLSFALTLALNAERLDYKKLTQILVVGLSLIVVYVIYWHVTNGFWSGWKRLEDTKRAFTYLPMAAACLLICAARRERRNYWIFWSVVAAVVFFSGERKALLVVILLTALLAGRGRLTIAIPAMALGLGFIVLVGSLVENPYIQRQIDTIVRLQEEVTTWEEAAKGLWPNSVSDAQRHFAEEQALVLFSEHPLMGVGTNGYTKIIEERFAQAPDYFKVTIHGEFTRIMAENGLIGLLLYGLIWIVSVCRFPWRGQINAFYPNSVFGLAIYAPCLIYLSNEAPGTHAFVALICVSMMPDIFRTALARRPVVQPQRQPSAQASPAPLKIARSHNR